VRKGRLAHERARAQHHIGRGHSGHGRLDVDLAAGLSAPSVTDRARVQVEL
jgi:hypothetical protein